MKRLPFLFTSVFAFYAAACSGGGTTNTPPPPAGPFSNLSLNGQYAFSMAGSAAIANNGSGSFGRVGSFTADGNGHITTGVEDVNFPGQVSTAVLITGGTYSISADGRGVVNLTFANTSSNLQFAVTMTSINDGLLMDATSNANQFTTATGNFFKQNPAAFLIAGINGNYVFDFAGVDPITSSPASFVGSFFSNSAGVITSGLEDINAGGALTSANPFTGSYAIDNNNASSGRGTALIDGLSYAFYIVDSTRIRFIGLDGAGLLTGDAVHQGTVPTTTAGITGSFVFAIGGQTANGALTRLGRFTTSAGAATQIDVDTLTFLNTTVKQFPTSNATNGVLTIDPAGSGRGTLTFKDPALTDTFQFVFYLTSASSGVIQDDANLTVADGSITAQTGGPFSNSNISGNYALNWSGVSIQLGSFGEEDVVGQVAISSLALKGTSDINSFNALTVVPDAATAGTIVLGGDGTGADASRNTIKPLSLTQNGTTNANFVVYVVNPNTLFIATTDTNRIVLGNLIMQH